MLLSSTRTLYPLTPCPEYFLILTSVQRFQSDPYREPLPIGRKPLWASTLPRIIIRYLFDAVCSAVGSAAVSLGHRRFHLHSRILIKIRRRYMWLDLNFRIDISSHNEKVLLLETHKSLQTSPWLLYYCRHVRSAVNCSQNSYCSSFVCAVILNFCTFCRRHVRHKPV